MAITPEEALAYLDSDEKNTIDSLEDSVDIYLKYHFNGEPILYDVSDKCINDRMLNALRRRYSQWEIDWEFSCRNESFLKFSPRARAKDGDW